MKNKKIFGSFAILAIGLLCSFGYNAYVTYTNIPRYAPTPYNQYVDNTYRTLALTYDSLPANGNSGNGSGLQDSITLVPNTYYTLAFISSVLDTPCLFIQDTSSTGKKTAFKGDILEIQAVNSSTGTAIKFQGPNWAVNNTLNVSPHGSPGAMVLTASKRANIIFRFDGTYWCELSRNVALTN